jgi:trans-2,3-dihydro-3-hydroxyanthranilate isomerase
MPVYPFTQVDAYTNCPLSRNPCAVLFNTDEKDSKTMLAVAREMNHSGSAFLHRSRIADFGT